MTKIFTSVQNTMYLRISGIQLMFTAIRVGWDVLPDFSFIR